MQHVFVEFDVLARAGLVVEALERLRHDTRDFAFADVRGLCPERHRLIHCPEEAVGIVGVEDEAVAARMVHVQHLHRVVQTARVVRHRERTVDGRLHLRQAARLEERRHEQEVRPSEAQLREASVKVVHTDAPLEAMERADIPERLLVGAVGDDGHLHAALPMLVEEAVEDVRQQLGPLLHRVEARRPEEQRRVRIFLQPQRVLERQLVPALHLAVVFRTILERDLLVHGRVVGGIGCVENAGRATGVELVADFATDRIGDEVVPTIDDLAQKRRRDGVDEVRGEDAGRLQIDRIRVARLEVVVGRTRIVEVTPELRRVDAGVLHLRQRELVRVDVVDGEKARNTEPTRGGGDETRHPVVAVYQVRTYLGDDMVNDFALERERQLGVAVAGGIDMVAIVKAPILGEVDAIRGHAALVEAQFVGH